MYRKRMNAGRGLAVFRMGAPTVGEWEEHFRDLDEVARWSKAAGFRSAVVVMPSPTFELPDAKTRAALAERTTQPGYDPYVAILHPNGVARGLLTMLQWMRGATSSQQKAFSSDAEALGWLEKERGELLPELREMVREVATERAGSRPDG